MKRPVFSLGVSVLLYSAFSCQKVIHVDLNSSQPQLVVEASLSDSSADTVRLTRTINFDQPNKFPPEEGAQVRISDDSGNTALLTEESPGLYVSPNPPGIPGHTFLLEISTDGKNYSATSTMPPPVKIDSLTLTNSFFGRGKFLTAYFQDSAGVKNYYRLVESVNGVIDNSIRVGDDFLLDGKTNSFMLYEDRDRVNNGDTITLYLQTIDKPVYDYFRTLVQVSGDEQGTAPANPLSNISNGALGYFSAYAVRSKTIILK